MITFTQGNLLEAETEVLVNTVNTVGVMGKGIALMFKERFGRNFALYADACKAGKVQTGKMFITEVSEQDSPHWIVNFPTKQHWRNPSRMEWVVAGLQDLRGFLLANHIKSIAIPPLGAGNGGLEWTLVKTQIQAVLGDLDIQILVYEPTQKYQNVAKKTGVEKLTPAKALIAELVRRYWVLGMECSILEIHKLALFLERAIERFAVENPLDLRFEANKYGPYANRLQHLLNALDGSYLHCDKRISDADPLDVIWFDEKRKDYVQTYLKSEAAVYTKALEEAAVLIDGFESPFGLELLATVDWLICREGAQASVAGIKTGLRNWSDGQQAAERKLRLFDDRVIDIALKRLAQSAVTA